MKPLTSADVNRNLRKRIKELEDAIKEHAAQRLDDRCQLDDLKLYKLVGINEHPGLDMPKEQFLGGCSKFYDCQQPPGKPYVAPTPVCKGCGYELVCNNWNCCCD